MLATLSTIKLVLYVLGAAFAVGAVGVHAIQQSCPYLVVWEYKDGKMLEESFEEYVDAKDTYEKIQKTDVTYKLLIHLDGANTLVKRYGEPEQMRKALTRQVAAVTQEV